MADVIATSQCPNCMGTLAFSPVTGKLECEFCNSSFTPEEIAALDAAKQEKAAAALEREEAAEQPQVDERPAADEQPPAPGDLLAAGAVPVGASLGEEPAPESAPASEAAPAAAAAPAPEPEKKAAKYERNPWDASTISEDWGEDSENMVAYSCSSCGGEIICESTTAATHCPYCGNNTIVPGQFSIGYKPNYIIPFKYTPEQAKAALRNHYRKKLFLPKEFTDKNQIDKLQGVYVPFWLFTGTCDANVKFDATKSHEHREGDYIVTETAHYDVTRKGCVPFNKVPTDASSKMPDDMMDSIEPFDFSELKPFSTAYLPGFLADKYDVSLEKCSSRADSRCQTTTLDMLEHDVKGYSGYSIKECKLDLKRERVDYALLPVYVIKTKFEDKTYLFAMNGQTGKLVGDLPASKQKFKLFAGAIAAGLTAVLFLTGFGGCAADLIWQFLAM